MGNQNVLQSLKSLDPAFHIIENNDFGSDPNKAPQIQLRGQQSMPDIKGTYNGNPNQPLFILDGFETDITTVYDLDMNRVETIVLLKDAAAKAIYGAKAARRSGHRNPSAESREDEDIIQRRSEPDDSRPDRL